MLENVMLLNEKFILIVFLPITEIYQKNAIKNLKKLIIFFFLQIKMVKLKKEIVQFKIQKQLFANMIQVIKKF